MSDDRQFQDRAGTKRSGRWVKLLIVAVVIIAVVMAGKAFNVQERLHAALERVQEMGVWGYLLFFAIYVVACVLLIPGSVLTLGAGAIYGVLWGTVLISISSTIGATVAFLVGRYLARNWVAGKIAARPRFVAIDEAVGREGWKIVGLTRLSPIFPFALLNYAYGLTSVKLRDYFLASWIGMLPGTVMYVYIGSLAQSLSSLGAGCEDCERTTMQWVLYGLGLLATVGVTVYVTRVARNALQQRIGAEPGGES